MQPTSLFTTEPIGDRTSQQVGGVERGQILLTRAVVHRQWQHRITLAPIHRCNAASVRLLQQPAASNPSHAFSRRALAHPLAGQGRSACARSMRRPRAAASAA